jgi:choice-of-anchor A domain-containing protein
VCAIALLFASVASADSILTPYNVETSGAFTDVGSIDVGGGLAAGGLVTFGGNNSIVARDLGSESLSAFSSYNSATLVAAGGVTGSTSATVDNGNYYANGGSTTINCTGTGCKSVADPIASFTTVFQKFDTLATNLDNSTSKSGNGAVTISSQYGTTTISVPAANTGLSVLNITTQTQLNELAANVLAITGVSSTSWLVINVDASVASTPYVAALAGNSMTVDGNAASGDSTNAVVQDVLFNFYNATTVNLDGSVLGSVLAPYAAVHGAGGGDQFDGSLVAASFTGCTGTGCSSGTEFHNFIYLGGQTPEPAPFAIVGLGLIALAYIRRRRQA